MYTNFTGCRIRESCVDQSFNLGKPWELAALKYYI